MQHQNLQLPQPRPHSIFCRRRNATRTRRHPRLRSTIPDRATGQIFRDYHSLRGPRDVELQGGRGWKSIGYGCVGEFFLSSPMLHLSRLTTAMSSSFFFHLHHIRLFPSRWNSIRIEIGDRSDEQSSKRRFDDEGSDSPVIYAQWMAEGVGGQAVTGTSHTP
jgi:hypothetical protein